MKRFDKVLFRQLNIAILLCLFRQVEDLFIVSSFQHRTSKKGPTVGKQPGSATLGGISVHLPRTVGPFSEVLRHKLMTKCSSV